MKKKILAVIMTIALVIGLVPTVALARESDKTVDEVLSAITENDIYVREDGYYFIIMHNGGSYMVIVLNEKGNPTYTDLKSSSALSVAQSDSVYAISGFEGSAFDFVFENGELTKIVLPSITDWAGSELSGTYSLYRISDSEMTWSKLTTLGDIDDTYYPIASTGLHLYQSAGINYLYNNEEDAYVLIGNGPTTKIKEVCKDKIYEVTCTNGTFVILIENEKIVAINVANSTVIPNDTYVINYSSEHTHVLGTAHTGVSGLRDYYDCTGCSAKKVGDTWTYNPADLLEPHTFADTWTSENGYHWHAPTCGHELDPEDCDGYGQCEDKTTVDNKCDVCGVTLSDSDKTYMDIYNLLNVDGLYYCCDDYAFIGREFIKPCFIVYSSDLQTLYQMDGLAHALTTKNSDNEYTVKTDIGSYTFTIVEGAITKVVLSGVLAADEETVLDDTYLPPHTHTFAAEWTRDGGYHWHESTCGCNLAPADCDGYGLCEDAVTVDNKCDVCGVTLSNSDKTYMDILGLMSVTDYYYFGDYRLLGGVTEGVPGIGILGTGVFLSDNPTKTHAITTKVSDNAYTITTDNGSYTFTISDNAVTKIVVTATYNQKVLDGTYLPPHEHTFSAEWTNNGTYHWHAPTCGCELAPADCDGYAACSGGTATCQSAAICKDCGKAYGTADANAHTFSAEWTSDGTYHWHAPTCGHEVVPSACPDYAACSGGTATCTSGAICGECGNAHGEIDPNAHPFSEEWTSVGGYHWHDVTCEHEIDVTEFVEKSNYNFCTDSDDDGFCDVCGEKLGTQSSVEVFVDSLSKLLSGEMSVAEATEAVVTAVMENVRETITQITEQINETISNAVETIRNIFSNLFGGLFGR